MPDSPGSRRQHNPDIIYETEHLGVQKNYDLVDQPAVELVTDDEAMLEALTLAGEEVIRADTDGTFCHPHATRLPCARLLNDLVCQD
jgi:hypothetical protein